MVESTREENSGLGISAGSLESLHNAFFHSLVGIALTSLKRRPLRLGTTSP